MNQTTDNVQLFRIRVRKLGGSGIGTEEGKAEAVMERFSQSGTLSRRQFSLLVAEMSRIAPDLPEPSAEAVAEAFDRFDGCGTRVSGTNPGALF